MLTLELTPVLNVMRGNDLPASKSWAEVSELWKADCGPSSEVRDMERGCVGRPDVAAMTLSGWEVLRSCICKL